jgi:Zn-dependent protease with chaperone function
MSDTPAMQSDVQVDFSASWFDGATARMRDASVAIGRGFAQVRASDRVTDYRVDNLKLSTPVAGVPLRIGLPDGGTLIVAGQDEQVAALLGRPHRSFAHRLEQNLLFVFIALVGVAAAVFYAYRDGLPWLAGKIAARVPYAAEAALGETMLSAVDRFLFDRSQLPEKTRGEIQVAFDKLVVASQSPHKFDLQFRRSKGRFQMANAFALPGGTVLVTDQLVTLMHDNDKVAGVLAHEIGHQVKRHTLVRLLESSATALIFGAILGDVSGIGSIAATAPGVVLSLSFSRGAEDEADRYAYDLLRMSGYSPALLGDALEVLIDHECSEARDGGNDAHADDDSRCRDPNARVRGGPAYLSTHPAIQARIDNARAAAKR